MRRLISFLESQENSNLIKQIGDEYPLSINRLEYYTRTYPEFPIKEYLTLLRIRSKVSKRIHFSDKLLFTEKGAMQSSSSTLAKFHADLFKDYGIIADLCCGCGIDLIELSKQKEQCIAVDWDEETLECAKFNCKSLGIDNVTFSCTKAEDFDSAVEAIFADPDRRPVSKRTFSAEQISPSLSELLKLQSITPNLAVKLSPIMDYKNLVLPERTTLLFVSEDGTMKEILLVSGELATESISRIAIQLPSDNRFQQTNNKVSVTDIKDYLFEPDSAIIRSGMVQDLAFQEQMTLIDSHLAILTSDKAMHSNWYKSFKVLHIMSYNRKQFQKYLTANNIGDITIKPRGFPEETEKFKKKLKLKGSNSTTCFILRIGSGHTVAFVERIS